MMGDVSLIARVVPSATSRFIVAGRDEERSSDFFKKDLDDSALIAVVAPALSIANPPLLPCNANHWCAPSAGHRLSHVLLL